MSLNCPYCNHKLTSGQANIHGTFGGFLFYGLSYENLYFKSESNEEVKILASNKSTPAMRCENCEIVILNKEYIERNDRHYLIEILTLCSSKELQDSFKESNPEVNIQEEIVKSWNEFYAPQKNKFAESFSADELKIISVINDLITAGRWEEVEVESNKVLSSITDI